MAAGNERVVATSKAAVQEDQKVLGIMELG